jgi:predicted nuclease of restriction endonuclease-like (RecB) superfamily
VREIDGEHLPRVAAEIPWGHNMVLIFKLKDPVQRLWYGHQATANGWSRSMLEHWIESPMSIAHYTTKLVASLPAEFKDSLPSPEEIEAELKIGQAEKDREYA